MNKQFLLFYVFLVCWPARLLAVDTPKITSLTFEADKNQGLIAQDIDCDIYGDSLIISIIPQEASALPLKATFTTSNTASVWVRDIRQESGVSVNDFSSPVYYTILSPDNMEKRYRVELVYTGLPVIYIDTEQQKPIDTKETYVQANIRVRDASGTLFDAPMEIKGRGNSTWNMPKKPYKVKLKTKASVLGMPADREWVLLANYADKTLLRNYLALAMGRQSALTYTPRTRNVDVVLNGKYQGTYLWGEQIKVSEGRVNIPELSDTDTDSYSITGGYLLEVDMRLDEDFWFRTTNNAAITIKSPEDIPDTQLNYIQNYVQQAENAIMSSGDPNAYEQYLDTETLIDWYWINELFKNHDAQFVSSVFMHKDRGGKLRFGPLWDFDIAAGNINYSGGDDPTGWWVRNNSFFVSPWLPRLFANPAFRQKAEARWQELRETLVPSVMSLLETKAAELEYSQRLNFYKWDILDSLVWPNAVATGSYEKEIDYLRTWLTSRIAWIDDEVGIVTATSAPHTEYPRIFPNPAKDVVFIPLPKRSGIKKVELYELSGSEREDIQYTLTGDRIRLQLAGYIKGVYLFSVTTDTDEKIIQRFVVE